MYTMLEIGRKALTIAERQIQTSSHNIANQNTPGYSRQRVIQESAYPISDALGSYGQGVEMNRLERVRDVYLDNEYRRVNSNFNSWNKMSQKMNQLQTKFNEPSDFGLNSMMNQFWDSWEAVANNPANIQNRSDLLSKTSSMIDSFRNINDSLEVSRQEINNEMIGVADNINDISEQLSKINLRIINAEASGKPANDLRDQFDLLIDELSVYGDVTVTQRGGDGTSVVYFGSDEIVKHDHFQEISIKESNESGHKILNIVWEHNSEEVSALYNGEIAGLKKMRDVYIEDYQTKLDTLAVEMSTQVNAIHTKGYDLSATPTSGRYFFANDVTGAGDIEIDGSILNNPQCIAASYGGEEGDNRIALEIAELRHTSAVEGTKSFNDYYGSLIYNVGQDTSNAITNTEIESSKLKQIDSFRESIKGVSTNEEAANLIKYQQSFQAAAKIISTADNLMQAIIGLV